MEEMPNSAMKIQRFTALLKSSAFKEEISLTETDQEYYFLFDRYSHKTDIILYRVFQSMVDTLLMRIYQEDMLVPDSYQWRIRVEIRMGLNSSSL